MTTPTARLRVRLASLAVIVVSLVALARHVPVERLLAASEARIDAAGWWGLLAFGAAYVAAALAFVPGSAITLASGAIFGPWWGTALVSVASTTAAALAFLIGRHAARDAVRRRATRAPRFAAIDDAIGQRGWKIVALLRLSPAIPFSLGNYLFGITAVRFVPYVLASWLAMLPGTFMYVYLGHVGRAGVSAAAGDGAGRTSGQWALLAAGLVATVVVTVYVARIARRAIPARVTATPASPPEASPRTGLAGTVAAAGTALVLAAAAGGAYARPGLIAGLFGPPRVQMVETYAPKPDGPTFDHAALDRLLRQYVSAEGGWVDYEGLADEQAELDRYLAAVAEAPIDRMGRDERLALLINAYNACTLRLILDHSPLDSIRDIPAARRWSARRWTVGGHTWSLEEIEHEQIRPHFVEPRIHFALVCAAVGCPPLRNEAYRAERLDAQLDEQARYVHANERWLVLPAGGDAVHLTSLYDWYGSDFEQSAGSSLGFAARYAPALARARDEGRRLAVRFLAYDWALNARKDAP
jgi:uncharacterized membrane protein YdjX (TVP38/TMEM64 family)